MEAEYVASCEAAKEVVWLKKFLIDLEVIPNAHFPITIYCDNIGAVANSKEPRSHKRRKYIERQYNLTREIVRRGDVIVKQIASKHNIADLFTTAKVFMTYLIILGLRVIKSRASGKKPWVCNNALVYCIDMLFLSKLNIMYIWPTRVLVQVRVCRILWLKIRGL